MLTGLRRSSSLSLNDSEPLHIQETVRKNTSANRKKRKRDEPHPVSVQAKHTDAEGTYSGNIDPIIEESESSRGDGLNFSDHVGSRGEGMSVMDDSNTWTEYGGAQNVVDEVNNSTAQDMEPPMVMLSFLYLSTPHI